MTDKKFHKTVFQVTVLSEKPFASDLSLSDIHDEITTGDCSGVVKEVSHEEMNGKQAADALYEQGSDPGFFMLDDEGNDDE